VCEAARQDRDALTALREDAERLRSRAPVPVDGEAIARELAELRHIQDLLELEFAKRADALAESGYWEEVGSSSPQDWIRHHTRMASGAAQAAVTVGAQAAGLQASTAAVEEGRIGYAHLVHMARAAEAVARDSGGTRALDEQALLQQAEAHSVGRFYFDCYHARHAVDPVGALQQHVDAVEQRSLEFNKCGDDLVLVSGRLDTVAAATVLSTLEPLARRNGAGDRRSRRRRLADAWVESCSHVLDQGSLPQRASQRPHVLVTATVETLMGAAGAPGGEMEFAGPVPAATVQRMACDSAVIRVLLDAESAVIDVGRARRTAPPATLRALRVRDEGCIWPGCERSVSWTTAHHVAEWVKHKGGTDADTMALLCYRHHWQVHEGGWMIARTDEGVITVPPLRGYVPGYTHDGRLQRTRHPDDDDKEAANGRGHSVAGAAPAPDSS
jgi:hypothetical protein